MDLRALLRDKFIIISASDVSITLTVTETSCPVVADMSSTSIGGSGRRSMLSTSDECDDSYPALDIDLHGAPAATAPGIRLHLAEKTLRLVALERWSMSDLKCKRLIIGPSLSEASVRTNIITAATLTSSTSPLFVGVKLSFPGNHATLTVLSSNNVSDHNNNYRTTSACAVWKLR